MTADEALTIRPRRGPQASGVALILALIAPFAYQLITGDTYIVAGTTIDRILSAFCVVVLLSIGFNFARSLCRPAGAAIVIDADGVHERGTGLTIRWTEVARIGYHDDAETIWVARASDLAGTGRQGRGLFDDADDVARRDVIDRIGRANGIFIPAAIADTSDAAIIGAIERFSRASGCALDVPQPIFRRPRGQ